MVITYCIFLLTSFNFVFDKGYMTASWDYDKMLYDYKIITPQRPFLVNEIKVKIEEEYKEWDCKQLITCEPADWIGIDGYGKAKPEDHCTYEFKTIMSTKNPVNFPEYVAYCEEITYKFNN